MCGRLLRTIYDLKQCGREWFLLLTSFLKIWFKLLCVDHSVFYNGAMWPRIKRLVHMEWEDPWHFVSLAYIKAMQAMTNITVKHLRFICVVIHWELYLYLEPSVIYSKRTLQESCPPQPDNKKRIFHTYFTACPWDVNCDSQLNHHRSTGNAFFWTFCLESSSRAGCNYPRLAKSSMKLRVHRRLDPIFPSYQSPEYSCRLVTGNEDNGLH